MSGRKPGESPSISGGRLVAWAMLLVSLAIDGALLWHFHDRYWYPTDDGLYAHIAERLLGGEILNRDIQDIHPGYIHFLHAAAFSVFGVDLVSLRYPLIAAAWLQGAAAFAIVCRRDAVLAAVAGVSMVAFGVIQFVDPTANWYCLALSVGLALWMIAMPVGHRARLTGAGAILGLLTLFRQLSGVWTAMGLLTLVLVERSRDTEPRSTPRLARALFLVMLAALIWYLTASPETEPGGVLLIAVWPLAILVWALFRVRTSDADTLAVVTQCAAGASAMAVPLVLYHVWHRSIAIFINDTVMTAFGETQMPFFGHGWYGLLAISALYQVLTSWDSIKIINGLYWAGLLALPAVNGAIVLRRMLVGDRRGIELPVLATFIAMGALYLEGPLYLYSIVGISALSLMWLAASGRPAQRWMIGAAVSALSVVAVCFHAGQSRARTPMQILQGVRVTDVWSSRQPFQLSRASLHIDDPDYHVYNTLVSIIERESAADDTIFVFPNDAELYFLARRRNPTRFYNSAMGLNTDGDLAELVNHLQAHPPRLVLIRPDNKYQTAISRRLIDFVAATYRKIDTIDEMDIYRRP